MAGKRFVGVHSPAFQNRWEPVGDLGWADSFAAAIDSFVPEGMKVDSLAVVVGHNLVGDSPAEGEQQYILELGSWDGLEVPVKSRTGVAVDTDQNAAEH
jgi:hypothetical protein